MGTRMLTLPNLLTLSRILAVPILVFLLWRPGWADYAITFVLYCLVGITDCTGRARIESQW